MMAWLDLAWKTIGRVKDKELAAVTAQLRKNDSKPTTYMRKPIRAFTGAWSTPSAVEFMVVRTAAGERPDQVVQVVEWLRTLYAHIGDWTAKPAPLHFEDALKEYVPDYDLDEEEDDSEDGEE